MTDPTSSSAPAAPAPEPGDDRERTIDSLLVAGLDLYFAGDYERAIHAWTRVLFLDRTHARARAYIERARSVLGERQRETDALLHRGLAALDAGDTEHARVLLASAVRRGGPVEAAEVALERLDRLEFASKADDATTPDPLARAAPQHGRPRGRVVPASLAAASTLLLIVAAMFAFGWQDFGSWRADLDRPATVAVPMPPEPRLPYPDTTELALRRARALFARGHLHQALTELSAVRADDPRRGEVDRLEAEVQRALLSAAEVSLPPAAAVRSTPGRP